MRIEVVCRATVEAGGLQLVPGRQQQAPGGRMPGRCPPRRVEAMMQWVFLRAAGRTETGCRLQLEPTGQPVTAAPSIAAVIRPAFKPRHQAIPLLLGGTWYSYWVGLWCAPLVN